MDATPRSRAKARRRAQLCTAAAGLFAQRGFAGVSLEEIGAAVGVSGPAVYRHFAGKQDLLASILVEVSERLRDGGADVVRTVTGAQRRLEALVGFHVEFALTDADVIRVQDRDLMSLTDRERHHVRRLQREYVETWVGVLGEVHPGAGVAELRLRAHAAFGLINSTPHSVRSRRHAPPAARVREILTAQALAALRA